MQDNLKRKSDRRIKNILRKDIEGMSKYWVLDQQRKIIENRHKHINAERNELGMPNLFPSPKFNQ
jgi:hypothetical protein